MSWMKRPRGSPAPVAGAGQSIFSPLQPPLPGAQSQPNQQPTWMGQQAPLSTPTPTSYPTHAQQQPQEFWQQPQPTTNYNNPPQQTYSQPNYQTHQPPIQNQYPNDYYQYDQQQYASQPPYQPQQNFHTYQNQEYNAPNTAQQPNFQSVQQNQTAAGARQQGAQPNQWETTEADPWDWGWQDDANAQAQQNSNQSHNNSNQSLNTAQQNPNQQSNLAQHGSNQQPNIAQQNLNQQPNPVQQNHQSQSLQTRMANPTQQGHQNIQQAPPANANILADSFANTANSWNWPAEEVAQPEAIREPTPQMHSRKSSHDNVTQRNVHVQKAPSPRPADTPYHSAASAFAHVDSAITELSQDDNKNIQLDESFSVAPAVLPVSEPNIKTLNDREALMEHNIPNLAMGRRFHADNLTPQWSIESQPSQDSSDGILSHTESSNRSEDPSRSSNKSSPGFNTNDNTNFNYAQPAENAWDHPSVHNPSSLGRVQDNTVNQELVNSVRTLSINRESVSPDKSTRNTQGDHVLPPADYKLPPQVLTPPVANLAQPPNNKSPQLPPSAAGFSSATTPNQNPFKRSGQLSHRNANNRVTPMQMMPTPDNVVPPIDTHPAQISPFAQQELTSAIRQSSPSLVNPHSAPAPARNVQQAYSTANLETTPDNSERPDIPPPVNFRPMQYPHPVHQNTVENFEVAPSNDRNEYLQTGHLSDPAYDNTNFADDDVSRHALQESYSPPGFRRMVVGQPESEFGQNSSFISDEPPPGLSRMVPGQLTDSSNLYTQPNDDYLDRQIDGQTTESSSTYMNRAPTVYRQVDGQPTDEDSNYNQNLSLSRNSSDRRPVGLDRMVQGESSSFNVQTFQSQNFSNAGDERVVPGFGQSNASEPREQNMDGSDYSEVDTNQIRSVVGAVEVPEPRNIILDNPLIQNVVLEPELVQRDLDMEGENLQDLSAISTSEFPMIRDQNMDGADIQDEPSIRTVDILDSGSERLGSQKLPVPNREQAQHSEQKDRKYRDDTTGDESERDRYKNNRKEKERLKSSKERDTRYGDRRDERRTDKDRRGETISRSERERGDDGYRRSNRDAKYETEDTDYYSDKDRRRYREGSYPSGKPPRPENLSRREEDSRRSYDPDSREERDGRRRKNTDPRDSRYDPSDPRYDPRDPRNDPRYDSYESERDSTIRRRDRDKERYQSREERDRRYARDERGYNSLRKNRSGRDDRKRDPRYPPRPDSRDPDPTEDELNESIISKRDRRSVDRDRDGDRSRQPRHRRDRGYNQQYYERYGYSMDPYQQQMYQHQQQTYQYYEKLRLSNPQAYLEIYNKYMAGKGLPANTQQDPSGSMAYGDGYALMPGYESASVNRLGDERGSVHSGRSSANGELKERTLLDTSGNYYYTFRRIDPGAAYRLSTSSLRRRGSGSVHSLHTDHSGSRDFNTDSINLGLENSTVKSERMTPVKFATAHIKGIISSTNLVTINPCYPMDGQPAIVEILDLNKILINDPVRCELTAYPGPLVKGVTHKKTVIEYCEANIRDALDSLSSPLFAHNQTSHNVHSGSHHNNNSSSHNSHSERPPVVSAASLPANADLGSYVLMWELLILLLRQNGMVVGTDIAELLVKNKRQFEWRGAGAPVRHLSRRGSTSSVTSRSAEMPVEEVPPHQGDTQADGAEDSSNEPSLSARRTERAQQPSLARNAARRTSSNTNILESSSQEKYITDRFREYLLFGSGKEALEWAMSHGLWGHALFLASKMDRRTYANVMTRFANGLAANDPLQTLYQLMSGRQPASVTCVLDEKWGDWRPHLAMILSNTSQRPELDRKSITQLGDTLQSRGDTYGAHFCYLMSREEFHPSRLQLLGLAPPLPAAGRTPSYAIIMTEIYEYACTLSQDNFTLGHFQFYKYLLATRLVDVGLYERALFYMESIANVVAQSPHQYQTSFVERVLEMADRLKHYDPEENVGELLEDTDQYGEGQYGQEGHQGQGRTNEKSWVTTLRRVLNDLSSGAILHEPQSLQSQTPVEYDQPNIQQSQHQNPIYQQQTSTNQQQWNQNSFQQHLQQQQQHQLQQSSYDQFQLQQQQQLEQQQLYKQEDKQQEGLETDGIPQMYDPTVQGGIVAPSPSSNSYIPPISQYGSYGDQHQPQEGETDPQNSYGAPVSSSDSGYWNHDQQQNNYGYEPKSEIEEPIPESIDREGVDALDPPRPQISMPNTARGKSPYDEDQEPADSNSSSQLAPKPADGKKDAPVGKNQSSGWFGGIFNKLSLKPKNQMILPDDKNPSIVWDSDKKKWTNLDADEDEQQTQVGLPPKMSDIMRPSANNNNISYQPQMPSGHTPPPPGFSAPPEQGALPPNPAVPMPNIFKLQKGRHIKKSYVDVFNPSGAPMKPLPPASEVLGASLQSPAPTSYFVPGVSNNNNEGGAPTFYNPANY